jgi:hypothetical protein
MTPHREVAVATHVASMVGARALTRLHQRLGPHHRAMRGMIRRVKKAKKNQGKSLSCRGFSNGH